MLFVLVLVLGMMFVLVFALVLLLVSVNNVV